MGTAGELSELSEAMETFKRHAAAHVSPALDRLSRQFAATAVTQSALDQALQPFRQMATEVTRQVQTGVAAKAEITAAPQLPNQPAALSRAMRDDERGQSFQAVALTIGDRLSEQLELDRRSAEALERIQMAVQPRRWPTWWEWVLLILTCAALIVGLIALWR